MDRLDFLILRTLLVNNGIPPGVPVFRKSFRSMGKELGVDQGTIRKRIKRFQERRVLKGWCLGVNPALTGHDIIQAWFEIKGELSKNDLVARLLSIPDVERACNYLGPKVSVVLFNRKGTNPEALLARISKLAGPGATLHKSGVIATAPHVLNRTDEAIITNLRNDPWRPFATVAKELGFSERTVKRRVAALSEQGQIYMLPIVDLKALEGIVPVELVVEYESNESRSSVNGKVASYVREGLVFSDTSGPYGYFALFVPNVSQVEHIRYRVNQIRGVRKVHSDVLQDVVLNKGHYEKWKVPSGARVRQAKVPILTEHVSA